jgi:hypothetical protein
VGWSPSCLEVLGEPQAFDQILATRHKRIERVKAKLGSDPSTGLDPVVSEKSIVLSWAIVKWSVQSDRYGYESMFGLSALQIFADQFSGHYGLPSSRLLKHFDDDYPSLDWVRNFSQECYPDATHAVLGFRPYLEA